MTAGQMDLARRLRDQLGFADARIRKLEGAFDLASNSRERHKKRADLAEAELASARQELDAVRTARDNLDREVAEARATIRALTRTQGAGT